MTAKHLAFILPVALALTACSADDDTELQSTPVVQINKASVQTATGGTRVSEDATAATQSTFSENDAIAVSVTYNTGSSSKSSSGTYTFNGTSWTASTACHWNTYDQDETVTAYYPSTVATTVSLANQRNGLVYLLKATTTAKSNTPLNLNFTHQLAKVRFIIKNNAKGVERIYVYGSTSAVRSADGTVTGTNEGLIMMHPVTLNGQTVFEATMVPGTLSKYSIDKRVENNLPEAVTLTAGNITTFNLTLEWGN